MNKLYKEITQRWKGLTTARMLVFDSPGIGIKNADRAYIHGWTKSRLRKRSGDTFIAAMITSHCYLKRVVL